VGVSFPAKVTERSTVASMTWDELVAWFTTVSLAEWLAAAAFAVSAAALYVSIWVDRAKVRVELLPMKVVGQQPGRAAVPLTVYEVTVTNTGRRPTKVTSIQLVLGKSFNARFSRRRQRSVIAVTTSELAQVSSSPPMLLDVGDTATMYFDRAAVDAEVAKQSVTQLHARAATSTAGYRGSRAVNVQTKP
jgi:hypothetical protein